MGSETLRDSMRLAKEMVDIALLCGIECRETAIKAVASLIQPLLDDSRG
jgi:hypothetical protein